MAYGPIGGLILIFIGDFLSSILIFFAVRQFGRKFIYGFVSKDKLEKLENSKWFSNEKRIDIIMFILFFIPGTPKDLLVYIGGLLPIRPLKFILIATFARFPSIISSTAAGSNLVTGNWPAIIMTYAITFAIAGLILLILNIKEKHSKITKT